ncbi:Nonribosomal peptide synthetase [Dispira simplex]|nr:Nonribosomal peptide synthetase [Dispira simplex]
MSPALYATNSDLVSWKPLRCKENTLGPYEHHGMDFRMTKVPGNSLWPVVWALLLNHCGGKSEGLGVSMGRLAQADGNWTVLPLTVAMDSQATLGNVVKERVYQVNSVPNGERSFHVDTMVGVVSHGEMPEEDLFSVVAQCMTQWDLTLTLVVMENKKSNHYRAYFIYDPAQTPTSALVQLADQFLRVMDYVDHYGLDVPVTTVLEFIGEPAIALPLYHCQSLVDAKLLKHETLAETQPERVVASTAQTRIWLDSQKGDRSFYHLVVIRLPKSVDSARVRSAVYRFTKQFPILVTRFVDSQNQVLRYEATDTSDLVLRVIINEALVGEPDQLRSLLHDTHHLENVDRSLFSVVEMVPNGSDRIEWLSVYCHCVLGDQTKFYRWVEQLRNLINDPSILPLSDLDGSDSGAGLDPTEFWKTHFSDDSLDLDLPGKQSQSVNGIYHINRHEPTVPDSLMSRLPLLMKYLSMNQLELLQGFMALFLLRLVRQPRVALFGQSNQHSRVPWMAQTADETSVKEVLHALTEQYRQSTQYDWSQFHFSEDSGEPNVHVTALPILPGYVHDFGQPYALTPLSLTWFYGKDNTVLKLVVDYDNGVYPMATIERLIQNFFFFTSQCCVDVSQDWRNVEVVHPDEQRVLLHEFSTTQHDYDPYDPMAHGVLDLFLSNVREYPESIAIECGDHRETYRSLHDKVQELVTHFHSLGIQRQERIAVIVESNPFTTVTLLALWALGAVYVPIDSQLPQERQQYMIEAAGCTQVLSTTFIKPDWIETIVIQDILANCLSNNDRVTLSDIAIRHPPDDVAYIVFTSGTTGQPKGLTAHYGAFNNLIITHPLFAQDCPLGSRWLLTVGVAFDPYLYGTFLSLCYGWTLVLASHENVMDVLPTIHGIVTTPSLIAALDPENYPRLQWVSVGGEALPQTLGDKWSPHCCLYNGYGPTEVTVVATTKEVKPGDKITIGRPLPNRECYILDNQRQLLPIGAIGEIFIGGVGVSHGYINRSDLNESRFLPNPFAAGRLYRTGDYGRWLPNGELECLGRTDDQVKLRGFRVELGEVRGALLQQSGIRDAFVMVVNKKLLVGFIIGEPEISFSYHDLRKSLGKCLPKYMIPHHLVIIQNQSGFPRTVNGKIDQQRLHAVFQDYRIQQLDGDDGIFSLDSLSDSQYALVKTVSDVLQLSLRQISLTSSLLQLGGDSVSAVQISIQCRQRGWNVPVTVLLQERSLEAVSKLMDRLEPNGGMIGNGKHLTSVPTHQWDMSLDELDNVNRELANRGWKPQDIQGVYPMLPMQQGMMAATARDPTEYVIQLQVLLHGTLSKNDIAEIIWSLVQSYDVMRVHFKTNWSQGNTHGLQVIKKPNYEYFLRDQWCQLEAGTDGDSYARHEVQRGFGELTPTIRFAGQLRGTDCHWLLVTAHHAVVDGWSVGVLLRSLLKQLNLKLDCKSEDTLPPPSFGDYSLYTLSRSSNPMEAGEPYWREYLANINSATIVSTPGDPNGMAKAQEVEKVLYGNIPELRDVLKTHAITIYTLIQTAWALTLNRYTGGQTDLLFGQVLSGREETGYANIDELVGCLVNTLPIRIQLTPEQSVLDLLKYVQRRHHNMLQHQHCHLTDINQWVDQTDLRVSELFNSLLVYQNFPPLPSKEDRLQVLESTFIRSSEFALTPMVEHCGDQLVVRISHRPRTFHTNYVLLIAQYMASCFYRLVTSLVENGGCVPALSPFQDVGSDSARTCFANQTIAAPTYAIDTALCVHDILKREAQSIGSRVAIEYGDNVRWTYAELCQRSQYIAYGLINSGVKREEPVGLVIDRQPSAIAAMFGILMAGAAYVPMNSDFPVERISFIVQDCGIRFVLTNTDVELDEIQVLDIDTLMDHPTNESPLPEVQPSDLSHIIYTSGTTGNPKGVQQEHRTVANYVQQPEEVLGLVPGLRMMQSMSLASDCSTIEVFGGLCNGVTLILRTDMLDTLAKVDTVMLTPSVLATIDPSHYPNITRALVGGEALPLQTAEKWARHCRLFNVYGPSECFATHTVEYRTGDPVTIGRVIGNIEAYILDDQLRPVPFGVPGEICLGGIGLTRGYVNRPELNRNKFITNPFNPDGSRLYRSGDIGRWLLNGTVEYFARKDDQVKIRGHRVEPQEIEAVMLECPDVVSAAVLPHDGKLYGFCSPENADIPKVKEYLDQRLPSYMIPQDVFSLESIPLTAVGKIDKNSLKTTLKERLTHPDERVVKGPTTPTEKAIHQAMGETLSIPLDHLDVRDSFFQMGGDSILAIRFSSLCRERGIQLSIAQIFRYKCVAALGELVSDAIEAGAPLPTLAPWELTLLGRTTKAIPTETISFIVAEEILSTLAATLLSVVLTFPMLNTRYDSVNRQLMYQSHPVVVIDQDLDASYRLDPTQGVWLSGAYKRQCNGLSVVTLVAHRVPLGRVGGWSSILQGMVKICPDLVVIPEPSIIDTLSSPVAPKYEPDCIDYLAVPYSGNPFSDDLVHSGLHAPLSVVILAGFLMALRQFPEFDSASIMGSGRFYTFDTNEFHVEESTSLVAEFQLIKKWYYDQLLQGENPGIPEAPILYHYSDVSQPLSVSLVEQRTSFWDATTGVQAAVVYRPNSLVLQLCRYNATAAESLLVAWRNQVNKLLDIPNQLQGTEHAFIPADFPHLVITSDDLHELVSEIHQDLGIPPFAIHDVYPLSTMQQNFVVNTLRDPTSYIVQHVFRISGTLDLEKYCLVWDELGKRHTILRTKFLVSRMVQVVTNRVDIDWVLSDTPLPTTEVEYQHTVRQLGFDLSGGHPLLRIHLFPDADGQGWLCFLAIHHAVIDGWSYQLLMNESLALYHGAGLTDGVPYRRFIDSATARDITADETYWTETLEGLQSTPDLPFPHLTQKGLYQKDAIVLDQATPLHHLCRTWGITFNVLLRGIWALVLTQYLGRPDEVTFGVMVSGRDGQIAGLDRLVGPTINTLPFRAKVDPQQSVVNWLQGLAEQSTQLLEHEQTSLVDIKQWAGLDADDQLFRSMIAVGRYLESNSGVEDSLIEYHSLTGHNDTEYPLMASFDEPMPGGALHLTIMANHESFYVDGLVDCVGHLLSQLKAVDSSSLLVDNLLQLSSTALTQVQAWIPGPTVIPNNPNVVMVPDLFTQHLAHQPHRVALETKDGQYTYHECYIHACRIGCALLDHGLLPGDKVALLFTRSADYFMAVLSTWFVGGVAIPMDATNAPTRLQSMVDSLGERAFLMTRTADDSGQVTLPDFYTAKIIVDNLEISADSVPGLPPFPRDPTALALIIHTSGTTGVPKGVMLRHESITNCISYLSQLADLPATCRFLQALNIAFDGCFIETLAAWSAGGTLVLQDSELVDDLKCVTHCLLTPSLLGVLNPTNYPQLELVFSGGEALPYNLANRWLATGKRVLNACGPTEITMACHLDFVLPHEPVSIGRPIGSTMCYILDDQLNLAPPGVPGQICIGGIGVSNGYWKRPDLTGNAFIDNPFGPGKIYLTGDLGCWLPNGKVHYIGRKDNQVKLRGFRIEMGEVESWCERLDLNIQQTVALVINKELIVYVSPQSVDVDKMRESLKLALPHYMVPIHIIPLDDMPKTHNGKVDRRALAEYPLPQPLTNGITYVDNTDELSDTYRLVASLALRALQFAETHPLPAPSMSFFTMGGDSISAVSFSTLCRKQGLNVTVAKIFTLQTFGAISAYCEAESGMKKVTLESPGLTHFQRWLTEEQCGSADMVVELQNTDQTVGIVKQPLGFTSANDWQNVLEKRYSTQLETDVLSEPINTTETGTTVKWSISPLVYPMFTTDKLYGQYQCTLSEALLAGFLLAWRKTQQGNVDVDLFRLTDNELVSTNWQQDTLADASLSPLAWLQSVKQVVRNADWSDISNCDNDHPRVLFHMVDPVVGKNIVRQRQQRLFPLLEARRRYALEVMMWYQADGTITLIIYEGSPKLSGDKKFSQVLSSLWKDVVENLVKCNLGTSWLPSDFPLVSFEDVQQLTVNPTRVQTVWPLSSLQQGFVIESLRDPSAYMVQLVYELQGTLDIDRYHQAWLTIGQRHDAMRVQFHPDQSVQVVMRNFNLEWDYGEQAIPETKIRDYLLRMRQRGFTDLTNEPLFRIQLLKQNSALHLCFITIHHAILDAWSIDVVLEEIRCIYQGLTLNTATVSYGQFLEHVTKIDATQTQSFWETYLKDMKPTSQLSLPKSENRPTESVTGELTTSLTSVRAWCNKSGITVNSLVRGLWALLLGRYLGQGTHEVTFGVMVTGRDGDIDGIDEMVGLTVNTIPFRVTLDRTQSIQAWLQVIHTQSGEVMSHSHVGLLDIETWVDQKSLFQSMLVNTKSRAQGRDKLSDVAEEGLRWVDKGGYNQVDYPLTVSFAENEDVGGLQLSISGNHGTSYYSSMIAYLNTILGTLIGKVPFAKLTVGDLLNQIPPSELECVQTWSQGMNVSYDGKPRLVYDLIMEGKSHSQLDAIALVSLTPPLEFTYFELITQAQLVSQRLITLDSSNRFIILFFERSPAFVLSMVGTLMAGKVCVPMDAAHTSERLIGMNQCLGEAHPVVLTLRKHQVTAEKLFGGSIICVDDLAQPTVGSFVTFDWNPPRITPTDLAFVYFTSGSTGKPKAVPERHESVVNYILGGCDILTLPPNCRFLQAMNIGFDSSLLELFTTFYTGGTVVLQSDDLVGSLGKVDACMLTPSMLQTIGDPSEYPDLRVVVTVGEPLPFSLAKKWCQTPSGQVQLFNTYGPTETVVTSHFEHVTVSHDNRLVTIGQTIPNVQCYILDDTLRMVPIGVIGEICIGGVGVCNGYLNDEQRSRDVFVPNPFGSGMLYRTGDLGCWLADGRVYCMGRKDNQVKVHGFRVELGEIEQIIRNSFTTDIIENACVVYDHNKGNLVGYVTPSDVDSESVMSALWERLPSYMVPDQIIPVDKFPLTSNGKVDRKVLLTNHPLKKARGTTVSSVSTMTPMQRQLVSMLCAMLHLDPDEVHPHHDTFFTLGGNSLSAMHFVSRCKADGIHLVMADINRHTTLAVLAKRASERADKVMTDLQSAEFTHGPFPFTPVQRMYFSWDLTDLHQWPLPLLMKLTTPRSLDEWRSMLTTLVSHHDMLRARFDQMDGEWSGRVLPIDEDPVMVNQLTLANETEYWRVIDETHRMMNITTGPIYLAYVMNYRDIQYFYLTLHHLIADNTSMNILVQDITTLLNGKSLSYKTLPYAIWSQNLDGLRKTVSLEPDQLPAANELVLPPADVDQTQCNSFDQRDQSVTLQVDALTTLALDQFGHHGTTAEDIILTGLLLAYTDVFDCTSIPLQYTSHGRNSLGNPWDVSHTVGFFVNVCPIVLRRNERSTLATTLDGVQSTLRGVSDYAVKYMLGSHSAVSPVAYNFFGKHDISNLTGADGVEVIDIIASNEFQKQRVNIEAIPLIFLAKYTGECLTLMVSYESSRYSVKCMSMVMEKWEKGIHHVVQWLKSQE